jgi:hypothetical protein
MKRKEITFEEAKMLVDNGESVYTDNGYSVIKNSANGDYLIKSGFSGHCIGLVQGDGVTLNCKSFFTITQS